MKRTVRLATLVFCISLILVSWSSPGLARSVADEPVVEPDFGATAITWNAPQGSVGFVMVVSGPNGYRFEQNFPAGMPLAFQAVDATGAPLADGLYQYELLPVRYDLAKARSAEDNGRNAAESRVLTQSQAQPSANLAALSGAFTVQNGSILDPTALEEQIPAASQPNDSPSGIDAPSDIVQADDVIIIGALCVGFDCVNNESFGFDTIRLKENNTRLKFEDTSTGAFPSNDWQLTANDSASGGSNKFSIEDITGAKIPFTVIAGAPSNSLFVDSSGRVGLGTASPVLNVHVASGNTPATRLEQNGTSGFTAQTWDIAGNEANFFVRDVTGGSRLPLRIRPGAPTSSLDIAASGNVGVGIASPTASLHVARSDGTAKLLVEETSGTIAQRNLVKLLNTNGNVAIQFVRTDLNPDSDWKAGVRAAGFEINEASDANAEFFLTSDGSLAIQGTLTTAGPTCFGGCRQQSDAFVKSATLLEKLADVSVMRWTTTMAKSENPDSLDFVNAEHLSPEMQSFYEVYGLGLDGQSIAPLDVAAVALASAQALKEAVDAQNVQIAALEAQLAEMEARIQQLEEMSHTHNYLPSVSNAP